MIIEVCGKGCPKCHTTKDNVVKALKELNLKEGEDVTVTHLQDPRLFAARGVMFTPAIVIDGVKVSEGKVSEVDEIKGLIQDRMT